MNKVFYNQLQTKTDEIWLCLPNMNMQRRSVFMKSDKFIQASEIEDFPSSSVIKKSTRQCRRWGFNPWVGKVPWRSKWQPTPVFLPGEYQRQRNLAGYSPWGRKRVGYDLATKQQQQQK